MTTKWSSLVSDHTAAVRAGGRRAHNALRRDQMLIRRRRVKELAIVLGPGRGLRHAISQQLGISLATVTRDLEAVKESFGCICPACGFYREQRKPRKKAKDQRDPVALIYAGKNEVHKREASPRATAEAVVATGRSRWR